VNRPLRVVLVCNSEVDGGAARSTWLLAREFDRARVCPVVVVHRESPLTARLEHAGVPYRVIPELVETPTRPRSKSGRPLARPRDVTRNLLDLARAVGRVRALARELDADVLYGQTTWSNLVAAAAARGVCAAVWHLRNDHSALATRMSMVAAARVFDVRSVIAVSHAAARPYARLGPRVSVVPNGVDLAAMRAARERPLLRSRYAAELPPDALVVGAAGRLVPHKGFDVLARAAHVIVDAVGQGAVRFAILGGTPAHAADDAVAHLRRAMPPATVMTGYLREPEPLLAGLDVLCVPSVYADPLPRVVLEGMALAVPQVASRIGGIPEMLRDGRDGYLTPPGDPQELAERVLRLLGSQSLRRSMGESARLRAETCFSACACARAVEQLLLHGCALGREVADARSGAYQM
jgi:glycosyltransferase involved in cell wall biosynthesis